jgi:hypothetical protein
MLWAGDAAACIDRIASSGGISKHVAPPRLHDGARREEA